MRDNEVHVIEVNFFFKVNERGKRRSLISNYSHSLKKYCITYYKETWIYYGLYNMIISIIFIIN